MSRNSKRRLSTVGALAAVSLVGVLPAKAHNAGHFVLPDGTCHEVGSFRAAPLVGTDKTALDLMPATPQDEYGASFAAFRGDTALLPGGCPR